MTFVEMSCKDFVGALASKAPVPGGGSTAALVGALGMALGAMVGSLTIGKPKYASVESELVALMTEANALQVQLLDLVQRDADVFEPLARAYGMPEDTEEQRAEKACVMEACLRACSAVPLEIMRASCEAIDLHEQFAAKGTTLALSDVGCGVACCKAALLSASLNVFINTKMMSDRQYAGVLNSEAQVLIREYTKKADALFDNVAARFI